MKKVSIGLLAFTILLFGFIYFIIPDEVQLKSEVVIKATTPGMHRMLMDKANIMKWWPGGKSMDSPFRKLAFDGDYYNIFDNNLSLLSVRIEDNDSRLNTALFLISLAGDSTKLAWVGSMVTSYNPIKRFIAWQKSKRINNNMDILLQKMNSYYSEDENIYGIKVKRELVKDSVLIFTTGISNGYPDTKFIYGLIDKLRIYASDKLAKETGYPMLNLDKRNDSIFFVRVALPIDKSLASLGQIFQKRMPANGNILVAEVRGGSAITADAFTQIIQYSRDYKLVPPAIPFYSLITDRTKEPDSSKWVTKIYCPVM